MKTIEWDNQVELTKALMMVLEFGEDNDGQIVFYSNCRNFRTEVLNDDGAMRGVAFGIEEFPDDPNDHQGDTCPVHEEEADDLITPDQIVLENRIDDMAKWLGVKRD
jgi:hypothetical protein